MKYIVITDDWYTGYSYDEWTENARWKPHGVIHEVPDEIFGMFEAVSAAAGALQDMLELMDKASRK